MAVIVENFVNTSTRHCLGVSRLGFSDESRINLKAAACKQCKQDWAPRRELMQGGFRDQRPVLGQSLAD